MKHSATSLGLVPLLVFLALSPLIRAQDPGQPTQTAPSIVSTDTDEAARLLYMVDGSVLRTRARHSGAGWEIPETKTTWKALPEGAVVRASLERDVLDEAKRLEQQVTTSPRLEQNTRRAGLADWMLKQGLTGEALGQLDRVLTQDPDQPQALHVITRLPPQLVSHAIDNALASDEPTIGVLRVAANATPTLREVAVQRLGAGGATAELRTALRTQLTSHSPRLRAVAAFALRRIYPGKNLPVDDVKELINRSVLDGSDEVRAEAARALRDVQDPNVTGPALRALNSTNPRLRENSIEALGAMGYPGTVEPLMTYLGRVNTAMQNATKTPGTAGGSIFIGTQTAYIQDFDVEVAQNSAIADPQVNVLTEGAVLDARVLGSYTVSFATEARLLRSSLAGLTGTDQGNSNRAWLAWWETNKANWGKEPTPHTGTTTAAPPKGN